MKCGSFESLAYFPCFSRDAVKKNAFISSAEFAGLRLPEGACIGSIEQGLLVFVGVGSNDTSNDVTHLASKLLKLRIFEDDQVRINRSLMRVSGARFGG